MVRQVVVPSGNLGVTLITHLQPIGVNAGGLSSGAFTKIPLNTIVTGADNIQGLASDQIQLIANSPYLIYGWANAFNVDSTTWRVQDVTNNVTVGASLAGFATTTQIEAPFYAYIAAQSPAVTIEIQQRVATTNLTTGFGLAAGTPNTLGELYSAVYLFKLDGGKNE